MSQGELESSRLPDLLVLFDIGQNIRMVVSVLISHFSNRFPFPFHIRFLPFYPYLS